MLSLKPLIYLMMLILLSCKTNDGHHSENGNKKIAIQFKDSDGNLLKDIEVSDIYGNIFSKSNKAGVVMLFKKSFEKEGVLISNTSYRSIRIGLNQFTHSWGGKSLGQIKPQFVGSEKKLVYIILPEPFVLGQDFPSNYSIFWVDSLPFYSLIEVDERE